MLKSYENTLRVQIVRFLIMTITYLQLLACHPPVTNYLTKHDQHIASWVGGTIETLIHIKGSPNKIEYLGWNKKTTITSEFWTPEVERYNTLFRTLPVKRQLSTDQASYHQLYDYFNPELHWLLVYETSIRSYRSQLRNCVEYYLINNKGKITKSGFYGTNVGDQKHCKVPLAYPALKKLDRQYDLNQLLHTK